MSIWDYMQRVGSYALGWAKLAAYRHEGVILVGFGS